MTDREMLLAAIAAEPADDVARLALADCIEYDEPDRAELIRVQCELANTPERVRSREESVFNVRFADLRERERALLAAHPHLSVTCPVCEDGSGYRIYCDHCKDSGCAGRFPPVRGFVESAPVPALASVFHRPDVKCPSCDNLTEWSNKDFPPHEGCVTCGNHGVIEGDWTLTPWARAVLESHPLLRRMPVGDREPDSFEGKSCWWSADANYRLLNPDALPAFLPLDWNEFEQSIHDTADLARDALAVAVCVAARAMMEVAHA